MTRMASVEEIEEFMDLCLSKLDAQVFALESDEAKRSAIQAVRYTLRSYADRYGMESVLQILAYGNYFPSFVDKANTPPGPV